MTTPDGTDLQAPLVYNARMKRSLLWPLAGGLVGGFALALSLGLHRTTEADYARQVAARIGGTVEVAAWDRTRVDILTEEEAIEVDFARKWAEAIGQALYYAIVHDREPGIVLLATRGDEHDAAFAYRCQTVCARHSIALRIELIDKEVPHEHDAPAVSAPGPGGPGQ